MNTVIKKVFRYMLLFLLVVVVVLVCLAGFLFIGSAKEAKNISWGVNFSQIQSQALGLDWKENYLALLEDMNVKVLKIVAYWSLIEPEKNNYNFNDLDWQIEQAEKNKAKVVLAVGMKAPRWPECHIPQWAGGLSKEEQQEEILAMVKEVVSRYRGSSAISVWQVENEPLFPFGKCPWVDKNFLKKEINLVKEIDYTKRPVMITDSGEGSFWFVAAQLGDVVGTTMYRKVWFDQFERYISYPLPPVFYARKAKVIEKIFNKKVIVSELQAEPWCKQSLQACPPEEQKKIMSLDRFREIVSFSKKTGFDEFYFWGAEWWYWLKEKQNQPQIWEEAKTLFNK